MRKIPLLILSLSALLAGCSSTTTQTLNNSDWSMGSDYYQIADIALPAFHLEQDENQQWKITGTTGCNRFFSDFEYQGQQLLLTKRLA